MKRSFTILHWKRIPILRMIVLIFGISLMFQSKLLATSDVLQEEEKVITGIVTDASTDEPLPGVSILIKGTSSGSITDSEGRYTVDAKSSDVLVFSYVGFLDEEIPVGSQTEINIGLTLDIIGLDEIVVIGYGVQKKKLVTGATTHVKEEDISQSKLSRIESSLQGLTPGMVIVKESGQPGSDYNITIRGLGSVNGTEPLVLIDGVPGKLNTLNPNDVESVDILKDAASAAIYGSRAADGVILVTTKKGHEGKAVVNYDFYYGISNPIKQVPMLNAEEYMTIMNEANASVDRDPFFSEEEIANAGEGTNWQDEATNRNAPSQSHYLGITGGNEKSNYSISLSYNNEEGIFDYEGKSYFERFGIRINSQHKLKKYLTVGQNLTYSHRNTHGLGVTNIYNNFMRGLLEASPLISVFDEDVYDGFGKSEFQLEQSNPIASMHYNYNDEKRYDDIIGNIYTEVEVKGLKLRSDIGATLKYEQYTNALDTFTLTPFTYRVIPEYTQKMNREIGYNWDNTVSYERDFGAHNVLAMVGINAQDNWFYWIEGKKEGYLTNDAEVLSNVASLDTLYATGDYGKNDSRFSVFGRLSYNYKEKYLLTASLRRDGSSRFGKNNRYGWFPAVSAGWTISEESFMETISFLNYMKIRGSWGGNGKEPTSRYQYLATVSADNRYYPFGTSEVGVSPDILANPSLKWEESQQINVGFDSRFLTSIRFTFDWYKKTSKDWIVQTEVPGVVGLAGISNEDPFINAGNVINTGVEFELGYSNTFGDLMVDISANFAYNKNKVTDVPGEYIPGESSVLYNGSDVFYGIREGYPIGYFFGYQTNGIFQTQEEIDNYVGSNGDILQPDAEPGDVIWVNTNGDSLINDEDKVMLGDPNPNYIYGLNINLSYKGFDFGMYIMGQGGNEIVQCYRIEERFFPNYKTTILDRWTGPGTSDRIPRVTRGTEANWNWRKFSDLYIYDADFLRIKSISIGYDFMKLFKNAPLQQCRLYVAANNLWTLTKYDGLDPEVGYGSFYDEDGKLQDAYASGIDIGFYPSPRTYLIGLNVTF
ncbi:MAG: TonB-dependent receptor [Bacteroidales bacterium]|nr:TonB-dependent receptor [Bacteroidales bacterium]